jgi:hypothetical protein
MEEDSIWIHPPNDQDAHIYCGPGEGPFVPCLVFATGFGSELTNGVVEVIKLIRLKSPYGTKLFSQLHFIFKNLI